MKRENAAAPPERGRRLPELFFFLALFLGMLLFYVFAHPLVLLSLDDWAYFGYARIALPFPTFWNPSRVLPEVLMPLCGNLAALLYACFGDYGKAQIFSLALAFSLCIAGYIFSFCRLLRKKLGLARFPAMLLSLGFLLLHFFLFRSRESGNIHLFYETDVVCVFFYTIPAMLNAALLMLDLADDFLLDILKPGKPAKKALLVLAVYLAVFSNLFGSVLFAAYVGCRLLAAIPAARKEKQRFPGFLKAQLSRLLVLLAWLISALFEVMGGRAAASRGDPRPLGGKLGEALGWFAQLCGKMSPLFLALLAAGLLFAARMLLLRKKDAQRHGPLLRPLGLFLATALLCLVFLVLLCAVVEPAYLVQPGTAFPVLFFLPLFLCWCAGYALHRRERLVLLLPLALLVIYTATDTRSRSFADYNCLGLSAQTCMEINDDLLRQVRQAEEAGQREIVLKTMDTGVEYDNWPHSTIYLGDTLADLFYKHGLVSEPVRITIQPSQDFNLAHGLRFGGDGARD